MVEPAELVLGRPPAPGKLAPKPQLEHWLARIGYDPSLEVIVYDDEGGGWAGRLGWTLDVIGHDTWGYLNGGLHAWHGRGLPLVQGPDESTTGSNVTIDLHQGPIAELEDVLAAIEDDDTVIWDVRSREEYLGLRSGSARAGHIPGAVNSDWLLLQNHGDGTRLIDGLDTFLSELGITPDKQVITHCQTHHRSGLSYMVARLLGYSRVRAYHGSWSEWGNRNDTPITS